jgi:hypothetical protein
MSRSGYYVVQLTPASFTELDAVSGIKIRLAATLLILIRTAILGYTVAAMLAPPLMLSLAFTKSNLRFGILRSRVAGFAAHSL